MKTGKILLMAHLLSFAVFEVRAETPTEVDYFVDQPIVLSVSRLAQPISRAPAAVTVITREMIEASGFRQLPDVFRLVPGFQVGWSSGSIQSVTYQGLSTIFSKHVQVLVDGRSVYNPGYGSVQWRGIPLAVEDIDRIEVVRGPNAANDGINSVVASIHVYTRPAAADQGWTVGANIGSEEIRDGLLRYAGSHGDWQWRATINSRRDDWLDNERDKAYDHLVDARAEWMVDNFNELTLQAGGTLGDWDSSSVGYVFSPRHTTDLSSYYLQARWLHTGSADSGWSLLATHNATHVDEVFPPLFGVLMPDNLNYAYSRSALEFSSQTKPFDTLRTVWTAEARRDRARSLSLAGPETHGGTIYRLSGSVEWSPLDEWVFHGGAMLEDHYYAGLRLSPRVAVNWLPEKGHSFRLGASRAYRSPTIVEQESDLKLTWNGALYDQILLSPYKLKPERMDSVELGYLFHSDNHGLDFDLRLFRNRLDDIIDSDTSYVVAGEISNTLSNIVYANLSHARQWGGEYQLRWQPRKTSWLSLSQSWVATRGSTAAITQSAPSYKLSLLASHDFGPVVGSLGYYKLGSMRWINSGARVRAHDRLDVRLSHAFKTHGMRGELALVAQSVLGDYSEFDVDYVFQPRAYLSLKLRF